VQVGNRRGWTRLQMAQSPKLSAFVRANPQLFEAGPVNMDVVLIVEPDGTSWVPGLGGELQRDEDGLPALGFTPTWEGAHVEVSAGYEIWNGVTKLLPRKI
jgi:hypothetical protein